MNDLVPLLKFKYTIIECFWVSRACKIKVAWVNTIWQHRSSRELPDLLEQI